MSCRAGGVSLAPWNDLNVGDHVGDDPAHVQQNRALWARTVGMAPVFLTQVHGEGVAHITPQTPHHTVADACWTDQPGMACTILVADCLPVLLAAPSGRSVAAVHAGWRGLAGAAPGHEGVLEALCAHWPPAQRTAARADVVVWLGPCIGPRVFEVGAEVRDAFVATMPQLQSPQAVAQAFTPLTTATSRSAAASKWLANLPLLARWRLQQLGFRRFYGNDASPGWCTASQPSQFFSHRRDSVVLGGTGRMAASIGFTNEAL